MCVHTQTLSACIPVKMDKGQSGPFFLMPAVHISIP